jgi:transforming growth factor-beta-induced protein
MIVRQALAIGGVLLAVLLVAVTVTVQATPSYVPVSSPHLSVEPKRRWSIWEHLNLYKSTSLFADLINSTKYRDFVKLLDGKDAFTLLAPNNEAVQRAIDCGRLDINNTDATTALLHYHILDHPARTKEFVGFQYPRTHLVSKDYVHLDGLNQVVKGSDSYTSEKIQFTFCDPQQRDCVASVKIADILSANGVMHVVDTVMTPPLPMTRQFVTSGLTSFIAALTVANISKLVEADAQTILAPDDAAWDLIPWQTMPVEQLQSILLMHVLPKVVYCGEGLLEGHELPTLHGQHLTVHTDMQHSQMKIEDAQVKVPDIHLSTGVLHIIDKVLIPKRP